MVVHISYHTHCLASLELMKRQPTTIYRRDVTPQPKQTPTSLTRSTVKTWTILCCDKELVAWHGHILLTVYTLFIYFQTWR